MFFPCLRLIFYGNKSIKHPFESSVVLCFGIVYRFSLNVSVCFHKIVLKEKARKLRQVL